MDFNFTDFCITLGIVAFFVFAGVCIRGCQDYENAAQKLRPAIFAACKTACGDLGVREQNETSCVCD
jgi:hypothetical protein